MGFFQATKRAATIAGRFGPLASAARPLFEAAQANEKLPAAVAASKSLLPLACVLWRGERGKLTGAAMEPDPKKTVRRKAIVLFSGGKDSTSAAVLLKRKGYELELFFVRGMNRAYTNELGQCRTIAEALDVPLRVETVALHGKSPHKENPFKNQFLLAMAVDYGVKRGFGTYVMGNRFDESIHHVEYGVGFSDGLEMFRAAKATYEALYAIDVREAILNDKTHTFEVLARFAPNLIVHANGCMLPPFRRPHVRNANLRKFGRVLLPGRCGSCYKCCLEWPMLVTVGAMAKNSAYWRHCMEVVSRHYAKTEGANFGEKLEPYFDIDAIKNIRISHNLISKECQ